MFHRTCMLVCSTQHIRCGVIARSCLKGDSRAPLMRIWHLRHTFIIGLTIIWDGANQVLVRTMDVLDQFITTFIQAVPDDVIIDAHTVIEFLRTNHSEAYLSFYHAEEPISSFHSRISKLMDSYGGTLLQRLDFDSYSMNIHHKLSCCACWRKIADK